jgi:hypothetical protein
VRGKEFDFGLSVNHYPYPDDMWIAECGKVDSNPDVVGYLLVSQDLKAAAYVSCTTKPTWWKFTHRFAMTGNLEEWYACHPRQAYYYDLTKELVAGAGFEPAA